MEKDTITRLKQAINGNRFSVLSVALLVCMVVSGCTVNRVKILSCQSTEAPIKASDVKLFSSFKEVSEPWRLEGMINAYTMPIMRNTEENRIALIKEEAAGRGINAVIGLQHPTGTAVRRVGRSVGLLAKVGGASKKTADAMPKFIVCFPPVHYLEEDLSKSDLDDYLLEFMQFYLGYYKGYYVYRCNAPGISKNSILQNGVSPQALSEPIGIAPDYALLCDVGWEEVGFQFVGTKTGQSYSALYSLTITMTLIDLNERKPISLISVGIPNDWLRIKTLPVIRDFTSEDKARDALGLETNSRLVPAIKSVPVVKGFDGADFDLLKQNR
jgi:hypothetical protein